MPLARRSVGGNCPASALHAWQDTSRGRDRPGNRANFDGRTTERAALTVNGPSYVSRDSCCLIEDCSVDRANDA
jgi:hypothetical protein